jgi:hypothetical protein
MMMGRLILGALTALALAPAASGAPAPTNAAAPSSYPRALAAVPAPFRGAWNRSLADCGTDNNDSAMKVSARTLAFSESAGAVQSVTQTGPREITVKVELKGEGERWTNVVRLELSPDGQALIDESPDAARFARRRCPG